MIFLVFLIGWIITVISCEYIQEKYEVNGKYMPLDAYYLEHPKEKYLKENNSERNARYYSNQNDRLYTRPDISDVLKTHNKFSNLDGQKKYFERKKIDYPIFQDEYGEYNIVLSFYQGHKIKDRSIIKPSKLSRRKIISKTTNNILTDLCFLWLVNNYSRVLLPSSTEIINPSDHGSDRKTK